MIKLRSTTRRTAILVAVVILLAGCQRTVPPTKAAGKPQRIVSMTLGSDELLPELVPLDRIVAVTHLADDEQSSNVRGVYPKDKVRLDGKDVEKIIHLAPDLICVASYSSPSLIQALKNADLSVYNNESAKSFDGLEDGMKELGERVGEPEKGKDLAARFAKRRKEIAEKVENVKTRPRVLYWFSGSTAGTDTTLHDVITTAGGINVGAELKMEGNREISAEKILEADPDYILLARWDANPNQYDLSRHPILKNLKAVREGRVILVDQRYLSSVSHYVLDGVEMLAKKLHPDCFPEKSP